MKAFKKYDVRRLVKNSQLISSAVSNFLHFFSNITASIAKKNIETPSHLLFVFIFIYTRISTHMCARL